MLNYVGSGGGAFVLFKKLRFQAYIVVPVIFSKNNFFNLSITVVILKIVNPKSNLSFLEQSSKNSYKLERKPYHFRYE